jgi:hypothetical protein
MKRFSMAGLTSVILYLAFVTFWVTRSESCFRNDGLFCNIGYVVAGFPWSLSFAMIPDALLPESQTLKSNVLFFGIVILSALINTVLLYRFGRMLGSAAERRKV